MALLACRKDPGLTVGEHDTPYVWALPPGAPVPEVPSEYPMTQASVTLGKALFFDARLSRDGTVSCASCHRPAHAFSDTLSLSEGVDGRVGMRNAPTLANVAYHPALFRDGGVPTLERQVIAPLQDSVEMDHTLNGAVAAVEGDMHLQQLSWRAYGRALDPFVITRAIACYERTLISGWSRYDRYLQGSTTALTDAERHGMELFNSAELNCTACHNGFDLSDHSYQNIGQYLVYADPGRERISTDPADGGKFKVPTLRNVAVTAPYMHDGSVATLEEVVDIFAEGGRNVTSGPYAGDGRLNPYKSPLIRPLGLSAQDKADLVAFLKTLTDTRFLTDPRHADPFAVP